MRDRTSRALLALLTTVLTACTGMGAPEVQVAFTAREVQAAIDKAPRSKSLADGLLVLILEGSPKVRLGEGTNRIGITAQLGIQVAGAKPVPATVSASAQLVYVEARKAFFLEAPLVEAIEATFLPKALEPVARKAASVQLAGALKDTPVYTLQDDGSLKERAARRLLKSVRIGKDEVVAVFALQ